MPSPQALWNTERPVINQLKLQVPISDPSCSHSHCPCAGVCHWGFLRQVCCCTLGCSSIQHTVPREIWEVFREQSVLEQFRLQPRSRSAAWHLEQAAAPWVWREVLCPAVTATALPCRWLGKRALRALDPSPRTGDMAWRSGAALEGDPGWGVRSSEGSARLTASCQSPVGTAKLLCTGSQQLWLSLDLHLHWAMN